MWIEIVGFDQRGPAPEILVANNRRIFVWRQGDQNRGVVRIERREIAQLDFGLLHVGPIIIRRDPVAVGVMQFKRRVRQQIVKSATGANGAEDVRLLLLPGHDETTDEHILTEFHASSGRDILQNRRRRRLEFERSNVTAIPARSIWDRGVIVDSWQAAFIRR